MATMDEYKAIRDGLDVAEMQSVARQAKADLARRGVALINVTPGDRTIYRMVIIDQNRAPERLFAWAERYVLFTAFGKGYPIPSDFDVHPGYVRDHWLDRDSGWSPHAEVVIADLLERMRRLGVGRD